MLEGMDSPTAALAGVRGAAITFERTEASSAVWFGFAFSASECTSAAAALLLREELVPLGGAGRATFAVSTSEPASTT
jgi:hypothetical protein